MISEKSFGRKALVFAVMLAAGSFGAAFAQVSEGPRGMVDEPIPHLKEFQRKLDFMAERLAAVPIDPDSVTDSRRAGITMGQHRADVADVLDEFTRCYALVQAEIAAKLESGAATEAEAADFASFEEHCAKILQGLTGMHLGATKMGMADHKSTWLLGAMEEHKRKLAEIQVLADECPAVIQHAAASAVVSDESGQAQVAGQTKRSGIVSSIDEPIVHLAEFQRKLDFMAERLAAVQADPEAPVNIREGAITLQQHAADVGSVRDELTKCLAGIKKLIAQKEASGTATRSDRALFKKCVKSCEVILDKLNDMHVSATMMSDADHKTKWLLGEMEKHREAVAEVQSLAAKCSEMMHETLKCCQIAD